MSKLLPRAKVKLENAVNDYRKLGTDDAYIDDCCYNLQQCIELCLKYIVELTGQPYAENHDVRAQLNRIAGSPFQVPGVETIRLLASVINSWEAESRYLDSFTATLEDIDTIMDVAKNLVVYCNSLVEEL